jgi:hypothetical protein
LICAIRKGPHTALTRVKCGEIPLREMGEMKRLCDGLFIRAFHQIAQTRAEQNNQELPSLEVCGSSTPFSLH